MILHYSSLTEELQVGHSENQPTKQKHNASPMR